jgi:cyclohexyl-isocyanide hydratase
MATDELNVGLLLFPEMTQLDLTGPYEVFVSLPRTAVHLVWKTLEPVTAGGGLRMLPTTTLATCPRLDVICVPGGPGQVALMRDAEVLAFLRNQAETCRYVTSVCTGSLVLGAAGLLRGFRATSHWLSLDQLAVLGATPVAERIVMDGNRITGGGVTSGIDFTLFVAAQLFGEDVAKEVQLRIEYDPFRLAAHGRSGPGRSFEREAEGPPGGATRGDGGSGRRARASPIQIERSFVNG